MKTSRYVAAAALALAAVTACGGPSAPADANAVNVRYIVDLTGAVSYAALPMQEGIEFALDEAKRDGELGDRSINVSVEDGGSKPAQAVTLMSSAGADQSITAVLQSTGSSAALGTAPIAERLGLPMLNVQSSAVGITEAGPHVYLAGAPPQELTFPLQVDYWKTKGARTIGIIYDSSNASLKQFAEKDYPDQAARAGMEITQRETISTDQTDFNAIATKFAASPPDAVLVGGQGAQNVRIITQLKQAGYTGVIGGTGGFAIGVQQPLGSAADGVTYPIDFSPAATDPATTAFVKKYRDAAGKDPATFTAEGYNAARLLIEAVKTVEGPITRESIQGGLQKIMQTGFTTGAQGTVTYVDRKARVQASLVKWDGQGGAAVVSQLDLSKV